MSFVTNIIISFSCGKEEEKIMESLLSEFTDEIKTPKFLTFDNCSVGGGKNFECVLFMAAFNYLDYSEFVRFIHSLKYKLKKFNIDDYYFEQMQIFIKDQDDEIWKIVSANDLTEKHFGNN